MNTGISTVGTPRAALIRPVTVTVSECLKSKASHIFKSCHVTNLTQTSVSCSQDRGAFCRSTFPFKGQGKEPQKPFCICLRLVVLDIWRFCFLLFPTFLSREGETFKIRVQLIQGYFLTLHCVWKGKGGNPRYCLDTRSVTEWAERLGLCKNCS